MQNKNLVLFIVFSLAILIGWTYLQKQLWPVPDKKKDDAAAKKIDLKEHGEVVKAAQVTARASEGNLGALLGDLTSYFPPTPPYRFELAAPGLQAALRMLPPQLPGVLGLLAQFLPRTTSEEKVEVVTIGDDNPNPQVVRNTHIHAVLTTRGAGVQKVALNRFKGADWLGKSTKTELELIPEDGEVPSFLMYHYPHPTAERPELTLGLQIWNLEKNEKETDGTHVVTFSTHAPAPYEHLLIRKTYRLGPNDYHLGLVLEIRDEGGGDEANRQPFRYQLAGSHGLPIEGEWYTTTFRNAVVGLVDSNNSLWRDLKDSLYIGVREGGERVPEGERGQSYLQYAGVMNQYFASLIVVDDRQPPREVGGGDGKKILAWARATSESKENKGRIIAQKGGQLIFRTAEGRDQLYHLLPRVQEHFEELKLKDGAAAVLSSYQAPDGRHIATWIRPGQTPRPYFDDLTVRVNSEPVELKPNGRVAHQFMLYHGPVKTMLLSSFYTGDKGVSAELADRYTHTLHLRTLTDYHSDNWFGRFSRAIGWNWLLIQCTKLMHWLLNLLQYLMPIPGLSIILLTVVVRGAMFPISRKQALLSMRMQELAPEMKKIQEKLKDKPRERAQALMEFQRKHNFNPLAGCLPLLMQMPFFLGLYYALQESVQFRLAGFLWIESLAAPDMLFRWGEGIPWISDPDSMGGILYLGPFLNVLPIAAVVLMIVQQKMMTPPPADEQQASQHRMMRIMMGVMGVLFYKVASGLCIYFIASSLWGMAERRFLPKKKDAGKQPVAPTSPNGKASPPSSRGKAKVPAKKEHDTAFKKVKNWWEEVLKQAKKK